MTADIDQFWWDTELRGFGVKVTRQGAKSFIVQYRMAGRGSKTIRCTIGKVGSPWDAPKARIEAARLLRLVAEGKDPRAIEVTRRRDEIQLSFPAYVERFLSDYGARKWRPKTLNTRAADLRNWVVPILKTRALTTITRADISAVISGLPATSPALPRNVSAAVSKLFAWAVSNGDIERSPCEGMDRPSRVKPRERTLDDEELILVAALAPSLGKPFGPFVEMLLLTGQRRDEVAGMTWSELDRSKRMWTIPQHRTKNHHTHYVPLGPKALMILDELAGGVHWPRKGFVFTTTGRSPISGYSRMKRRLDGLMAQIAGHREISPWRLHDLRRTMATNMQKLQVRLEVTEALLNHRETRSGIVGVYQLYDWKKEKREAVRLWDQKLTRMGLKVAKRARQDRLQSIPAVDNCQPEDR